MPYHIYDTNVKYVSSQLLLYFTLFDEPCFLETDLYEFLLNIANREFRTIGIKVHIKQYEKCGYISNIYQSVLWH